MQIKEQAETKQAVEREATAEKPKANFIKRVVGFGSESEWRKKIAARKWSVEKQQYTKALFAIDDNGSVKGGWIVKGGQRIGWYEYA